MATVRSSILGIGEVLEITEETKMSPSKLIVKFEKSTKEYIYPDIFFAKKDALTTRDPELLKDISEKMLAMGISKEEIKSTLSRKYQVGCGLLIENTFVPNMEKKGEDVLNFEEDEDEIMFFEDKTLPTNGMHIAKIVGYEKRGDFYSIKLKDVDVGNVWYMNTKYINSVFGDIHDQNHSLNGKTRAEAFAFLEKNPFQVWTYDRENGFCASYFNKAKYNNFVEKEEEKKRLLEEKELEYSFNKTLDNILEI